MAVTYRSISQVDLLTWHIVFSSNETTPVDFRFYREGQLIQDFQDADGVGDIYLTLPDGEQPFIEVLDKANDRPAIAFPGKITLNWEAVNGATKYKIEESVDSVWTERATILDNGQGAFIWNSRWLEDVTTHIFRVTAIDAVGNEGTPIEFSAEMVRHPDTPDVSYEVNNDLTLTISSAE